VVDKRVNKNLKAARTLRGLTQAELGEKIGKSATWICQLERGRVKASDLDVALLCRALQVRPKFLFPDSIEKGLGEMQIAFLEQCAEQSRGKQKELQYAEAK
jgi:transcriptional regulator with XRE-family HTH domain